MSVEALGMIEAGEAFVRSLGFRVFRVRHHLDGEGPLPRARVQIAPAEMAARLAGAEEFARGIAGCWLSGGGDRPAGVSQHVIPAAGGRKEGRDASPRHSLTVWHWGMGEARLTFALRGQSGSASERHPYLLYDRQPGGCLPGD